MKKKPVLITSWSMTAAQAKRTAHPQLHSGIWTRWGKDKMLFKILVCIYACIFVCLYICMQTNGCVHYKKKKLCWDLCVQFHFTGVQDEGWSNEGVIPDWMKIHKTLGEREWSAQNCMFTPVLCVLKQALLNGKIACMNCVRPRQRR